RSKTKAKIRQNLPMIWARHHRAPAWAKTRWPDRSNFMTVSISRRQLEPLLHRRLTVQRLLAAKLQAMVIRTQVLLWTILVWGRNTVLSRKNSLDLIVGARKETKRQAIMCR